MTKEGIIIAAFTTMAMFSLQRLEAQGTLTMATDPTFGPNSLIVDTATGLNWLNLKYTDGLSYDQVIGEMAPGELFAGFTYASSLFADGTPGNANYSPTSPAIATFIDLVGSTGEQNGYPYSMGEVLNGPPGIIGGELIIPTWGLFVAGYNGVFSYGVQGSRQGEWYGGGFGSWLVEAVPEPKTWCLCLLAAPFVISAVRKRSRI
jgi:hypothetical protein